MAYEIELHYGFERSHDTYETYHAFEATDIEEEADVDSGYYYRTRMQADCVNSYGDTVTANPCALLSLRERWSASERRVMRLAGLAYWLR